MHEEEEEGKGMPARIRLFFPFNFLINIRSLHKAAVKSRTVK